MVTKSVRRKAIIASCLIISLFLVWWKVLEGKRSSATSSLEEFQALPYVQWSSKDQSPKLKGVTVIEPSRVSPGYNLYTNDVDTAFLMDLNGKVLHQWKLGKYKNCEYAQLLPMGELIAVCMGQALVKVDWNSNKLWKLRMFVHHDVEALPDRSFFTVRREPHREYRSRKVVFDCIQRVSATGSVIEKWCTFDHLEELQQWHKSSPLDTPPEEPTKRIFDYYHLNTIKLLPDNPHARKDRRFQKGNLLVCLRNANLIAILDKDTMKIVWGWGTETLDWPHMPNMLPNGNILIFDNGFHRKFSRVVEMNPVTGKIVWTYTREPKEQFFSAIQGCAQRLPNGNTLICDSANGHAFEVDPQGKIVWDFLNPEMKDGRRKTIYRFLRLSLDAISQFS
jgi:Arylsulfotransferase (ASST)